MTAPRVKVYGLLSLTRRAYLTCQVIGLLLAVAVMALGFSLPRYYPEEGEPLLPFLRFFNLFLDLLPWIAFGVLILMAIETYIVLRKFDRLPVGPAVPDSTSTSGTAGPTVAPAVPDSTSTSGTAGPTVAPAVPDSTSTSGRAGPTSP
jgi:hypothetical protein